MVCAIHLMSYNNICFLPCSFGVLETQIDISGLVLCLGFTGKCQCDPGLCSFLEILGGGHFQTQLAAFSSVMLQDWGPSFCASFQQGSASCQQVVPIPWLVATSLHLKASCGRVPLLRPVSLTFLLPLFSGSSTPHLLLKAHVTLSGLHG